MTFHITRGWMIPGLGLRSAHYHYEEMLSGRTVVYEECLENPQVNREWMFIHEAHPQILKSVSASLATELADEINAKYLHNLQC